MRTTEGQLGVQGVKDFDAFERTFVFVGVSVRSGRENEVLTGSVEIRESAESAVCWRCWMRRIAGSIRTR